MKKLLILIAGPVRSGTQNRPELIEANLNNMAQVALSVYKKGHIPVVGEWLALPIAKAAGSTQIGDEISEEYLYPVAHRLISRCDAILRLPGESRGADLDIEEGKKRGLSIYYSLEEIPDR
ncbi:TPA: NUDIX hydrolase [Klebsiella oxytoca]|uniref:NUDIX hydrolase n=1 Tax=Klebsiella TaxID=570 RepID=UPI0018C4A792|nr:NUDIX hydrolase [Klebsiella oxytoca]ELT8146879.1 NUDIX hydrolase [Klebsiella oxytoca]ELT9464269.1 NUDIX hydrolase [Klebsiella oxytoca]EME8414546.1 NUDIX hydrolase [Klebsiella oxytoca]MBG2575415.1 NUDIX hydrolase [Klebsiella oxytoca]MDK6509330.1 NUDIX hydrolase [Klebsiella oxytoca]